MDIKLAHLEQVGRSENDISIRIEQIARLIYGQKPAHALHSVQWAALRYFAHTPSYERTVAGLAKFLGVTSAPASRTASSLLKRELVSTTPSPHDFRSKLYELTESGYELLQEDPIQQVTKLLRTFDAEELSVLENALDKIYTGLSENV